MPYKLRQINRKEIVNEYMILTISVNLMLFTEFTNDDDFQYDIAGWAYVGTLGIILLFNLSFIFASLFTRFRLNMVKNFRIIDNQYHIMDRCNRKRPETKV